MSNILLNEPTFLTCSIDTLEVSYYLSASHGEGLDFSLLSQKREVVRQWKKQQQLVLNLGDEEFALFGHGTKSGYPYLMQNEVFQVALGEFNRPNFHVKISCKSLWHEGYQNLHSRFLSWAASVGMRPTRPEVISRVDIAVDYLLPTVDFDLDCFVSQAEGDGQRRKNGKVQTFQFGSGDKMLRVYNKSAEIKESSHKIWFYPIWGGIEDDVWRIEWQTRRAYLQTIGINTLADLSERKGDLLRVLATDHTSLRCKTDDSNRARWPLHPLWQDYLQHIEQMPSLGVVREFQRDIILEERLHRIVVALYGYLKRVAAIYCLKKGYEQVSLQTVMQFLTIQFLKIHDPTVWGSDVSARIDEMRFGHE